METANPDVSYIHYIESRIEWILAKKATPQEERLKDLLELVEEAKKFAVIQVATSNYLESKLKAVLNKPS